MKTVNAFWKIRCSLWCCLALLGALGSTVFAQPVVKVPMGCEVIVTGTGTGVALGFGGFVGAGGVVAMPDPFDMVGVNGDFTITTNGTTGHGWSLLGDLSFQTGAGIITGGAGLVQNIESFNKNPRASDGISPSLLANARCKGRVTIGFISGPCGGSIFFDVFKRYSSPLPPVIGPSCWDPNTVVTYSVNSVASDNLNDGIGTDKYYWEVTNGISTILLTALPSYASADGSSITFTTPAAITGTWTVKCAYGRANPWDGDLIAFASHTSFVTKTIGTPVTITWATPPPTCLNTGITTFTATVSPVVGYNYSWSYTGSGTPIVVGSGGQGQTVTVSGMNDNPGSLILTVTNTVGGCPATQVFTYPVNRNFVTPFVLTTSPASPTCLLPGGTFTVSLPATAQLNNTTWTMPTVPSTWTFTGNPQSSVITVTVPAAAQGGQYTLTARSTACPTGIISLVVFVKPVPVFTAGPTCVGFGSTTPIVYTVSAPGPGPFTYTWTIPPGWTGTSATNTITVTPNGTSVGNVTCNVCTGTCCTSISRTVAFPTPPVITGPACYNVGLPGTAVFTIAPPVGTGYTWSVNPTFGTISGANNLTSVTVTTIGTPGLNSTAVSVVQNVAGCGNSAPGVLPVTLTPNGSLSILGGTGFQVLSVINATGSPAYQWLQNCGLAGQSVCTACGTGSNVLLQNAATGGQWGAFVIAAGCTTRVCTTTVFGNRYANPNAGTEGEAVDALANEVTLSPNPNGGEFEIRVATVQTSGEMIMFNAFGQQVFTGKLRSGNNRFNQSQLASGMYFLHITVDGKVSTKKMEIQH
jgi:hypothetical protein